MDDITTEPRQPGGTVPASWKAVNVIALVVAFGAVGAAGYLWSELDDLRDTTGQTDSRIGSDLSDAERRISSLESDVGYSVGFDSIANQIDALDRDLDELGRKIDQVEDDMPRSLEFDLNLVALGVDDLRSCLNEYMDVVARAGGGRYTYYHC